MTSYVGRFAPSPTGQLHFGSLVTALASYLDARSQSGIWLVRIEDLDPPREEKGATESILRSLECHGLNWDKEVIYQSKRAEVFDHYLEQLSNKQLLFRCNCTRQRLSKLHGSYDGHCLTSPPESDSPSALKIGNLANKNWSFDDRIQGFQKEHLSFPQDSFVLVRKDTLYAYQLAVVCDDIEQGITHIVRGNDLLSSTARQILLFDVLEATPPSFAHIPLVLANNQQKLSKQNKAPVIDNAEASMNLLNALKFLNQSPPENLSEESPETILSWSIEHWQINAIPKLPGFIPPNSL
ncbi:tRNA glutamyl-Q(34) synthetase GluQRS [Sessilibacter corallicola]|uniref:tRNA glutamyl-Q(34) synthetase GluQRS n=1 Tax=Sessilibacter corallicola TaxID=2904075 RepID=UPI001E44AC71|nr:tRNA glutamyl-Q(34) synthetase GluQRS [Sessilibacter corallicola]MCE2027062.1 tRNA glutamyl-Q(34) synthetase GluQRS [Sessilibacter corallicola]